MSFKVKELSLYNNRKQQIDSIVAINRKQKLKNPAHLLRNKVLLVMSSSTFNKKKKMKKNLTIIFAGR